MTPRVANSSPSSATVGRPSAASSLLAPGTREFLVVKFNSASGQNDAMSPTVVFLADPLVLHICEYHIP